MDTQELKEALAPFLKYAETNDGDTLARISPDEKVIATAQGSWMPATHITLGDIRRLAEIARTLG